MIRKKTIFLLDNAKVQSSAIMLQFSKAVKKIKALYLPPNNSFLNPIEFFSKGI